MLEEKRLVNHDIYYTEAHFDLEIKESWLAKWQEITKDKSSLKIFFSSCQRVKINQNF